MKRLLTLSLALCFTWVILLAQESEVAKQHAQDSVLYSTTFYFKKNQSEWIDKSEYLNVGKLLRWAQANNLALINIKGWAGQNGTEDINARLSFKRAKAIRSYLVQKGIDSSRITAEEIAGQARNDEATNHKPRGTDPPRGYKSPNPLSTLISHKVRVLFVYMAFHPH